jgi:hypothetical protein
MPVKLGPIVMIIEIRVLTVYRYCNHPILETWPSIYRGQEGTVWDRLKASKVQHPSLLSTPLSMTCTAAELQHPWAGIIQIWHGASAGATSSSCLGPTPADGGAAADSGAATGRFKFVVFDF